MSNLVTLSQAPSQKLSSLKKKNTVPIATSTELARLNTMALSSDPIKALETFEDDTLLKLPQDLPKPTHYFGKDLYVREVLIKKGTIATGRVHKFDHVSIVLSGHMTVWTPYDGLKEVRGPCVTEVPAGMKRAGFAHEDTHWITAHSIQNHEAMSEDEIFDFLTVRYYQEYIDFLNETFGTSISMIKTNIIESVG